VLRQAQQHLRQAQQHLRQAQQHLRQAQQHLRQAQQHLRQAPVLSNRDRETAVRRHSSCDLTGFHLELIKFYPGDNYILK